MDSNQRFCEGYHAYMRGEPDSPNPYQKLDDIVDWDEGFKQAARDKQKWPELCEWVWV